VRGLREVRAVRVRKYVGRVLLVPSGRSEARDRPGVPYGRSTRIVLPPLTFANVAVIVVRPSFTAVTMPELLTVAIIELADAHCAALDLS